MVATIDRHKVPTGPDGLAREPTFARNVDANGNDIIFGSGLNALANVPTYNYIVSGYTGYATPTDIFSIFGSTTKTVAVLQLALFLQATAAGTFTGNMDLIKRTTANTGGTPTALTPLQSDSADAAATATVSTYAAAPTLGTATLPSGGLFRRDINTAYQIATSVANAHTMIGNASVWYMPPATQITSIGKPLILRGAGEGFCVNFNSMALPAGFVAMIMAETVEF